MSTCTEDRFLHDVANHEMEVLRDKGLYRHIRFKRPDSGCMYFDLITWPGSLCYTGDMGTYVFRRVEDMFEFFRTDQRDWNYNKSGGLSINPSYWSEKLIAVDGNRQKGSATEFDADRFRAVINEYRVQWIRDCRDRGTHKNDRRALWDQVQTDVLDYLDEDPQSAMTAAYRFSEIVGNLNFQFHDIWDHNFERFTFHFIWCCYALAWGVKKYDEARK